VRSNALACNDHGASFLNREEGPEDGTPDSTIKKVEAASSPRGEMGQKYLVAGKRISMRLWVLEPGSKVEAATSREYETVGYVISGRAKLDLEGQTLNLKAGDSWLVPAGAMQNIRS
jgi:quercetin dioxygenase-like cupin family protein